MNKSVPFDQLVIPEESAKFQCNEFIDLNLDHFNIVKPDSDQHDIHRAFANNYIDWRNKRDKKNENTDGKLVYIDVCSGENPKLLMHPISRELTSFELTTGGQIVPTGKYAIEINDNGKSVSDIIDVSESGFSRIYQISERRHPNGTQLCYFGNQKGTKINVERLTDGGSVKIEKADATLTQENNKKCFSTSSLSEGSYVVTATRDGYPPLTQTVIIKSGTPNVCLRFNFEN